MVLARCLVAGNGSQTTCLTLAKGLIVRLVFHVTRLTFDICTKIARADLMGPALKICLDYKSERALAHMLCNLW